MKMKFDTLLKLGTHAAKIVQHDSFQEMSKMIHKGVKRRMQTPDGQGQGHSLSPWQVHGPLPPYRNRRAPLPPIGNSPHQSQTGTGIPMKQLLTPDNLNAARQLLKLFADRGNAGGNKDNS
jgi:hypothetical protein